MSDPPRMRIVDEKGQPLSGVYIALTDREARTAGLPSKLIQTTESGWHAHVIDERSWSADERERVEHEVTAYRADDETACSREMPDAWASVRDSHLSACRASADLLGEPDENALGASEVAEPIHAFVLNYFVDE